MSLASAHRFSTRALIRRLRAAGGVKKPRRKPGRWPPPQHPDGIAREYHAALVRHVCEPARDAIERVMPDLLAALRELRREQGRTDAAAPVSYQSLLGDLRAQLGDLTTIGETAAGPIVRFDLPGSPVVVIVTGQHGEEQAGPLMLARHGRAIVELARAVGVGLRVYPCVNPEGFQTRRRRDRSGDANANAFAEYLVGDEWRGELEPDVEPDGMRRPAHQAPETRALYDDLVPWALTTTPVALLDLHQDCILPAGYAFGYINAGPRAAWARLLARAALPLARRRLQNSSWSSVRLRTGTDGLVEFRDGSITDWAAAVGVPLSLALEAPICDERGAVEIHRAMVRQVIGEVGTARTDDKDAPTATPQSRRATRLIGQAAKEWRDKFHPSALHAVVEQFGKRADHHARQQLDQQLRSAMGVPLSSLERPMSDRLGEWTARNVALVKTVPERYFDRLQEDVQDAFAGGMHPDTFADELADRYEMSERDAERIARDQMLKLSADLNHARFEALGVERAIWHTVNDNRVCDECFDLEGQEFDLAEGIDGALPGECHNCDRCYSEPVLDDLLGNVEQPTEQPTEEPTEENT